MIITIANQKGGVGKTTTAVTLAHGLALNRGNTLLIDLDPQGQCATALGLPQEPGIFNYLIANRPTPDIVRSARDNLEIIPGDSQTAYVQLLWSAQNRPIDYFKHQIKRLLAVFNFILIDTSPSIGGLQERALYAADLVYIPTACDYLSASSVGMTINTIHTIQSPARVNILPTFYDETTKESNLVLSELRSSYLYNLVEPIHRATILRECAAEGLTIWEKDPTSRAAHEYASLVHQIGRLS